MPYLPATFDESTCDVLLEHERLLVLGAPLRDVLLMKLYRNDLADRIDMRAIWPHAGFATIQEAAAAYRAAYPHEPDDQYLDERINVIANPQARPQ